MAQEITQIRSDTVYQNQWMTVREDAVRFPNGHEGIYGVVEKVDFSLIVPIHDGGRIEMVEQFRYPLGGRFWELPQGSWETDETLSPLEVARRELLEETGLVAQEMTELGYFFEAPGFCSQGCHLFVARDLSRGQRQLEATESDLINATYSVDEIVAMIKSGGIRDAVSIAAIGYLRLLGEL